MKKILGIASLALVMSATVAQAQYNGRPGQNGGGIYRPYGNNYYQQNNYYGRGGWGNGNAWAAGAVGLGVGALIGGLIASPSYGYAAPAPVYGAPAYAAPVVVAPPPPPLQCWNQSVYNAYGQLVIQKVCQ